MVLENQQKKGLYPVKVTGLKNAAGKESNTLKKVAIQENENRFGQYLARKPFLIKGYSSIFSSFSK